MTGNNKINEFRPEFLEFSKILVYFWTGVLNFDYFQRVFSVKFLVSFAKVLDV